VTLDGWGAKASPTAQVRRYIDDANSVLTRDDVDGVTDRVVLVVEAHDACEDEFYFKGRAIGEAVLVPILLHDLEVHGLPFGKLLGQHGLLPISRNDCIHSLLSLKSPLPKRPHIVILMVKLGIVADDLTGANDTGVQFAKVGLKTLVLWNLERVEGVSAEHDVVVVDTESRGDSKEEAYRKAFVAAGALKKAGASLFYKKIDSTLRGNIGAELDGVLDALGVSTTILCPAFPRNRRVTVGGHQLVGGIPVERTEMGRDPIAPVKTSYIPTLIGEQSRRRVGHVPLTAIIEGSEVIKARILKEHETGIDIFVSDAVSDDDLRAIAQAAFSLGDTPLLCGSAGLAEEIPHTFGLLPRRGGVLVLAGTVSMVTAQQIDVLERMMQAIVVTIDSGEMFGGEERRRREMVRVRSMAKEALNKGRDVVVRWARSSQEAEEAKKLSISLNQSLSQVVLSTFGEIARVLVDKSLAGLILTGGDTTMNVMNALEATGINIQGEVEAGVPAVTIAGGRWDGLRVVTKAGAFGDDLTLTRAVQYLRWTR